MATAGNNQLHRDFINNMKIRTQRDVFKDFVDDYRLKVQMIDMDARKKKIEKEKAEEDSLRNRYKELKDR